MAFPGCVGVPTVAILLLGLAAAASAQLSPTFYDSSCPSALATIKSAVTTAVNQEPRMGASLLRLHFHDCFVQGCDASVLLNDTATFTGEQTAFPNRGSIRGLDVIDGVKAQVEAVCAQTVSCADILAVAARDSIVALGGSSYTVPLGRRDSTTASLSEANSDLPPPTSDLADLVGNFSRKGLSVTDMVALSGAHTIGQAACRNFRSRIYGESNINASYAASLQANCPQSGGDSNLAPLDVSTPNAFDNAYYNNLVSQRGLLHSDQQLFNGGSTDALVRTYASSAAQFSADFATAVVNMGNIGVLTGAKIWHGNMPYGKIAERKGHQGWMKQEGSYFVFPGGGTMFPDGAEQYIEKLTQYVPLKSGLLRTGLDMGCGVASFGGFLLKENITTLSFAPRDSHKSQIQFALERGIPAFLLMLGTRRLPFPAQSFDFVHCSRCLIPFTAYNGSYLIEVDRLLRPGGYLIISGPPVQWKKQEKEWGELQAMTQSLCYKLITVDGNTAIWKKPNQASCLPNQNEFGLDLCSTDDDPDEAWYFKLKKCISKVSLTEEIAVGSIAKWPDRLSKPSARASLMDDGANLFEADTQKWVKRVSYYKTSLGVKLGTLHIRNAMDMNAFFGGLAAAVASDPVWVMNVVPAKKPLTLGVIYDRGLIGVYHDWCEPFSTYPRTYDLIHADGINSLISDPKSGKRRCELFDVMLEMDRILRPEGTAVIRDSPDVIDKAVQVAQSIRWTTQVHDSEPESGGTEKILVATKTFWKLPLTSG